MKLLPELRLLKEKNNNLITVCRSRVGVSCRAFVVLDDRSNLSEVAVTVSVEHIKNNYKTEVCDHIETRIKSWNYNYYSKVILQFSKYDKKK